MDIMASPTAPVAPTTATGVRHGFASVVSYFPGGRRLLAELDEAIVTRALGGWNPEKAEVYSDQYISSGGQLAELVLGRDRMVLDLRPLIHAHLGHPGTLCSKPYDLCTELIAREAGCVVCDPFGQALGAPLDTTTNVAFAGFANRSLAESTLQALRPILARHGIHQ